MAEIVIPPPMGITARLLPGVVVGPCVISLQAGKIKKYQRRWTVFFDFKDGSGEQTDNFYCHKDVPIRKVCGNLLMLTGIFARARNPKRKYHDALPTSLRPWAEAYMCEIVTYGVELLEMTLDDQDKEAT